MVRISALLFSLCFLLCARGAQADWNPAAYLEVDTLEFRTDCPDEGEYWSPVWLNVLDGDVYVALGKPANARVQCNSNKPFSAVKIAGETFPKVRLVPAPAMGERIEADRDEKYFMNILFGMFHHEYYKLVPSED